MLSAIYSKVLFLLPHHVALNITHPFQPPSAFFPCKDIWKLLLAPSFTFFMGNHPFLGIFHPKGTPGHVLTSRDSSAPGTGWLSHPSQEHRHAVDHHYNHDHTGLGTRYHLTTAANGCLQTNLTCSRASPAPKERLKSFCTNQHPPWDAQSHAPTGQRSSEPRPGLPLRGLLQSHFPNQSSALHSSTSPEVPPAPSLPI